MSVLYRVPIVSRHADGGRQRLVNVAEAPLRDADGRTAGTIVLLEDIKAGAAAYERLLARAPSWQNSGEGADRVLFTLDNMTLELMAPSGFSLAAYRIRNVIKIWGEGLASVCFATPDIAKIHRRLERVALKRTRRRASRSCLVHVVIPEPLHTSGRHAFGRDKAPK